MKKKYYWFVGIVTVIIIIALGLYFLIFQNEICNGLQNKLNEEVAKINVSCNVDSDCIRNTDINPCGGVCINNNADLRNYESTWHEIATVCPPGYSWYLCPNLGPNPPTQCICIQGSCEYYHPS